LHVIDELIVVGAADVQATFAVYCGHCEKPNWLTKNNPKTKNKDIRQNTFSKESTLARCFRLKIVFKYKQLLIK
jgi:hypothetical protein